MANVARPNGLSPYSYTNGAPWNGQARLYAIPTADTTASYAIGDIVQSKGGADSNGIPYVIKVPAASASAFVALGVIVGISPVDTSISLVAPPVALETNYIVAGTRSAVRYVYVADDPNLIFQASVGSTGVVLSSARKNFGLAVQVSGSNTTYAIDQTSYLSQSAPYSNIVVDNVNTTATLPLTAYGFVRTPDNAFGDSTAANNANARILVRFQFHEFLFGTASASGFTGV